MNLKILKIKIKNQLKEGESNYSIQHNPILREAVDNLFSDNGYMKLGELIRKCRDEIAPLKFPPVYPTVLQRRMNSVEENKAVTIRLPKSIYKYIKCKTDNTARLCSEIIQQKYKEVIEKLIEQNGKNEN